MKLKTLSGVLILSLLMPGISEVAEAKVFKNCVELRKVHKYGVASSLKWVNKGSGPMFKPSVSAKSYSDNKKKDLDRDGIACEVSRPVAKSKQLSDSKPKISFSNLDATRTSLLAQSYIAKAVQNAGLGSESILVVRSGPSIQQLNLEPVKKSVLHSAALFKSLVNPEVVNVNWFSAKDHAWVDQAIVDSGGSPTATPDGNSYSNWIRRSVNTCNMGNASIGSKGPYFNQCLGNGGPINSHSVETAAHEYFHIVQYSSIGNRLPFWFMEGTATFAGIHVGGKSGEKYSSLRSDALKRWATNGLDLELREAIRAQDRGYVVSRLRALESQIVDPKIQTSGYALGMLINESLVACGGIEKWLQYLSDIRQHGINESLEMNYGITNEELYESVSVYVLTQLQQ